jgi:hypothetical protein
MIVPTVPSADQRRDPTRIGEASHLVTTAGVGRYR